MKYEKNSMTDDEIMIVGDLCQKIRQLLDQNCSGMDAAMPLCALANVAGAIITSSYNANDFHAEVDHVLEVLTGHLKYVSN